MKLNRLVDPQYQTILKKLSGQEIPLKTAFKLRGIIKACSDELAKYDEVRGEALKRLGDKKEDGALDIDENGTVHLSDENKATFVSELSALLDTEVSLGKIKIGELGEKASLTTQELLTLDDLITD